MWVLSASLLIAWFILKFLLHWWGGYVHMLLVAAITVLGVQLIAYRKAQYHKTSSGR